MINGSCERTNGVKGAFFNCRANGVRPNAFDDKSEALACAVAAVLPDSDTSIKFAELCNDLESGEYDPNQQIEAIIEFAYLTANEE